MNPSNFGLLKRDFDFITKALITLPEIEKAVIFGSRAMGNYKKGSDIDIAIFGDKTTSNTITRLSASINQELPIPYFVDVIDYNTISNIKLKEHIEQEGKIIYNVQKAKSGIKK